MAEQGENHSKHKSDSTDRRVLKTRRAIHNAFVELITEKSISEITVKDITELAHINRKTFYNHYTDMRELIDEIQNDIINAFDEAMAGINVRKVIRDPDEMSSRLLAIGHNCSDLCSHIMNITYNGTLVDKIARALKYSLIRSTDEKLLIDDRDLDMLMEFIVAGMLQTYQMWFNSDRSEPVEEVTRRISLIIVNGIKGITQDRQ